MDYTITPSVRELRRLLYCGEFIESHALHIYMLQAPDLLKVDSVFQIAELAPEVVKDALRNEKPKIAPKLPETVGAFRDGLKDGFNELLDDTCRYVKWVFEWPRVVSIIRSVPLSEFRSDFEWSETKV